MTPAMDSDSNKDLDYSHLIAQNKALYAELTQCQADKDFVWSLWKRLQVSNPDVAEAISLVLQREKEKAEAKDHRVLEILQVKDDRIEELQNIVARQSQEISDMLSRKVDLQEKCERLQTESERLHDQLTTLELKLKGYETKERSMDEAYRHLVEESEKDKHELQRKVSSLSAQLDIAQEEKTSVIAKRSDLERTVRNLERDVVEKIAKFDGLIRELEEKRKRAEKAERQVLQLTHEVDFKNQELETIRKELRELWSSHNQLTEHSAQQAQLILQLQSLQHDTQIMIKNQEDAFSVETKSMQQMYQDVCGRYETSKLLESELRQQILHLKKELMERDDSLSKLEEQLQAMREQLTQPDRADSFLGTDLHAADRSTLAARRDLAALRQLEKTIDKLDQSMDPERDNTLEFNLSHAYRSGRHSTPSRAEHSAEAGQPASRRSRSFSPHRQALQDASEGLSLEQKLADTERMLELRNKELEALRKAHSRRLERLTAVQQSEKLLQEQIKTYEQHKPSRKKKAVQRGDPRQLQKEDSDAVWNELAYFKAQCRNMEVERVSLQEDIDELKVQVSVDAATIHELRVNLQAQREEFEYQLRKRETSVVERSDLEGELLMLRSRVQNKDVQIAQMEKELSLLAADRDTLQDDKKTLKNQTNELQQELSKCRIQIADLRHALQRQERALQDGAQSLVSPRPKETISCQAPKQVSRPTRWRSSLFARRTGRSIASVKKYQRALNKSIERMSHVFQNFRKDDWEEVSESGEAEEWADWEDEEEDNTETTGDSLGASIARHAKETTPGLKVSCGTAPLRNAASQHESKTAEDSSRQGPSRGRSMQPQVKTSASRGIAGKARGSSLSSSAAARSEARSPSPQPASHRALSRDRERVVLRETSTSPIRWAAKSSDTLADERTAANKSGRHQLAVLKQRVLHLSKQLAAFKQARTVGLNKYAELQATSQQLASDLNQATQRLKTSRLTCQRLAADVERMQREKQSLEHQMMTREKSEGADRQNDSDKKLLEARLKMSTSEVSRQAATIRSLKTEVDTLQDQIRGFQDRINHLERDNNQKRNLVESQRIKLKSAQDSEKSHDDVLEELQTKLKLSTEGSDKMRVQLESLKKRIRVVQQEKRDYEDKYLQVSLALEKKAKELSACREQRSQLESTIQQLETLSQQQLQRVATHSEAAVDAAQAQMSATQNVLAYYQQFVRLLCAELLDRVKRTRGQLRDEAARSEAARIDRARASIDSDTASLKRAQDTARDILNISQSDLDDIMSCDGDQAAQDAEKSQERKNDRRWLRKCEKAITCKGDFVRLLVSLILQKVDERADLLMTLTS